MKQGYLKITSSGWREKVSEEAYRSFRKRSPQFWSLALQFILLSKGKNTLFVSTWSTEAVYCSPLHCGFVLPLP